MRNILICIILSLSFVGCDFLGVGGDPQEATGKTDSTKVDERKFAYSDSIAVLKEQVCRLDSTIKSLNNQIEECKGLKSERFFWAIVVAIIFALLISVYDYFFCKNNEEKLNNMIKDINHNHSRICQLKDEIKDFQRSSASVGHLRPSDLQDIKERLSRLEKASITPPKEVKEDKGSNVPQSPDADKKKTAPQKTIKYFGNVKGNFFNDIYDSCKEEAKFQVEISGDKGKFSPISLDRIKSLDNISKAVKYEGVQINVATDFDVKQKGEVEKDGDVWEIKKPVILKLR